MGKCDLSLKRTERRQPKMNRRLCHYILTTSTGECRVDENDRENFKRHAFYPVFDSMTGELQRHFFKPNCTIMKGIQAFHPQSITFFQEEALFSFAKIFDLNVDDLANELYQIKRVLERKEKGGMQRLTTLVELVVFLEPSKEVFHELFIAIVIPVSSAPCERRFSGFD